MFIREQMRGSRVKYFKMLGCLVALAFISISIGHARADNLKGTGANIPSAPQTVARGLSLAAQCRTDLFAISVVNGQKMWAVGRFGIILYSPDGGKSWELQESNVENNLNDVFFQDESSGWIVGQQGLILETKDGGKNWTISQNNKKYHLFSLGHNDDSVFAVGELGTILYKGKTENEWKSMALGEDIILNKIVFLNNNIGWICGEFGLLLKTESGGKTWTKIETIPGKEEEPFIYSVAFRNEKEGVITLPGNKVMLTDDGGQSWKVFTRRRSYYDAFDKDGQWWFIGEGGVEIFDTTNNTWEYPGFFEELGEVGLWLRSGKFLGGEAWFAGSAGNIIMNNGSEWRKIHPGLCNVL